MILLYTYNPAPEFEERQKESKNFLLSLRYKVPVTIVMELCRNETDYAEAIASNWRVDNLLLMEQDIVPLADQVKYARRLFYQHHLFAFPYYLYQASTLLDTPVLSHRVKDASVTRGWRWGTLDWYEFQIDYMPHNRSRYIPP